MVYALNSLSILQKTVVFSLITYYLVGMHFVLPTPGGAGLYLAPNIITWIFVALVITCGLLNSVKNKVVILNRTFYIFIFAFSCLMLPLFYGGELVTFAIPRLFGLAGGILLFLALMQCRFSERTRFLLLFILLVGVMIEAGIGLIQYYILSYFKIDILGYTPVNYGRPYGSFTQPNVMSTFMVTGVALSLFLKTKLIHFNFQNTVKASIQILLFCCPLLIVVLQSKTGYFALIIVILCFTPLFVKSFAKFKQPLLLILFGLSVGTASLNFFQSAAVKDNIYSDKGVRTNIYKVSARMMLEKPISGFGYGSFERSYREFHLNEMRMDHSLPMPLGELGHPHNEIFLWGIEGGLVALVGLGFFAFAVIRLFINKNMGNNLTMLAIIIPILLHSQLEYPFYHSAVIWVYFIVFIWFANEDFYSQNSSEVFEQQLGNYFSRFVTVFAIGLSCIAIPFMLTTIHTSILMERYKISQYADASHLVKIINPIAWQQHYEMILYLKVLKDGYKNKDSQALQRYIQWGREFVKQKPRIGIYKNMLTAIKTLKSTGTIIPSTLDREITEGAVRLYPQSFKQTKAVEQGMQ